MDTPSVAELEQHAELLRERVMQVADEVKALLAEDLPRFVEREVKRAFVSQPEFAAKISDDRLRQLKQDIEARGGARRDEILAALGDESLWLVDAGADDERKSIAENTALWEQVAGICGVVTDLQREYGFPEGSEPVEYKPPTWFIGRRYLPTLSEKYWRHLRELGEARAQVGSIRREASKSELTKRWDEAG